MFQAYLFIKKLWGGLKRFFLKGQASAGKTRIGLLLASGAFLLTLILD